MSAAPHVPLYTRKDGERLGHEARYETVECMDGLKRAVMAELTRPTRHHDVYSPEGYKRLYGIATKQIDDSVAKLKDHFKDATRPVIYAVMVTTTRTSDGNKVTSVARGGVFDRHMSAYWGKQVNLTASYIPNRVGWAGIKVVLKCPRGFIMLGFEDPTPLVLPTVHVDTPELAYTPLLPTSLPTPPSPPSPGTPKRTTSVAQVDEHFRLVYGVELDSWPKEH